MIKRQDLSESREITQMEYDDFIEELNFYLDLLMKRPENHGKIMNIAIRVLGVALDLDLEKEKITDLITLIKEFGKANFISALKWDNKKEITFQNKKYPFALYDGKPSYIDPSSWRNCFFSSVILRDTKTIKLFNSIPSETHFLGGTSTDISYHKEIELLKMFFKNGSFNNEIYNEYFVNINRSSLDKYDYNYISKCIIPCLTLLKNISENEEKLFNKNLETALLLHKEFWSSNVNDRFYDSKGWISLPILAVASKAFDSGFNIEVASEYAPLWLIKKEFI